MPVKKDPSGRRSVEAEAEVPGTPEEVWQAIATGPGISSWFVPSTVEERADGTATSNFGPGMESVGKISLWQPPHRFVVETEEGGRTVGSEWIVEARGGGNCVVRVVHSWFSDTDDWDSQFEGHTEGWKAFFRNLRLYLTHFKGLPSAAIQLTGFAPEPRGQGWEKLTKLLGFKEPAVGRRVQSGSTSPLLAGIVERIGEAHYPEELLLRLDAPAPGLAHFFAMPMGGMVLLSIRFYLYGERASSVVAEVEPSWQEWIATHFPPPGAAPTSC